MTNIATDIALRPTLEKYAALDVSTLSKGTDLALIEELKSSIDIKNTTALLSYGSDAQKDISDFADTLLKDTSSDEISGFGGSLEELIVNMSGLDTSKVNSDNFFSKLPIIGDIIGYSFKKFTMKFDSALDQINRVVAKLEAESQIINASVSRLDAYYDKNLSLIRDFDLHIRAAEMRLHEIVTGELMALKEKALSSNDIIDIQSFKDMQAQALRLEHRIANMITARFVAVESAPTIRQLQENFIQLISDFHDVDKNVIPMWKRQFMLAIEANKQGKMAKISNDIKDFSNAQYIGFKEQMLGVENQLNQSLSRGILDANTLNRATELSCEAIKAHRDRLSLTSKNMAALRNAAAESQEKLKQALLTEMPTEE